MRTARAVVLLATGQRPKQLATVVEAQRVLTKHAAGAIQHGPVRFVGYDTTATHLSGQPIPDGTRAAVYEADYEDAVAAVTLANVSPVLRPTHVIR